MTDLRWTPAEQHVPHLLLDLMHMGTADVGGRRIEQYKHSDTRRYLNLDHTGQAWQIAVRADTGEQTSRRVDFDDAIHHLTR